MDIPHVMSYDIACQYSVNIIKRFRERFPLLASKLEGIIWLLPKLHAQAHKIACQILFTFNYMLGVGRTDGEEIERFWAEMILAGGMTKQMNGGHRHDILNAIFSYYSWIKNLNLGKLFH